MFETSGRPILLTTDKNDIYAYGFFGTRLNDNDFRSFLIDNLPIKFKKFDAVYTLNSNEDGWGVPLKNQLKRNRDINQSFVDVHDFNSTPMDAVIDNDEPLLLFDYNQPKPPMPEHYQTEPDPEYNQPEYNQSEYNQPEYNQPEQSEPQYYQAEPELPEPPKPQIHHKYPPAMEQQAIVMQYGKLNRKFYRIIGLYAATHFDVFMSDLNAMEHTVIGLRNNSTDSAVILKCNILIHNIHTARTTVNNNRHVISGDILTDIIKHTIE